MGSVERRRVEKYNLAMSVGSQRVHLFAWRVEQSRYERRNKFINKSDERSSENILTVKLSVCRSG